MPQIVHSSCGVQMLDWAHASGPPSGTGLPVPPIEPVEPPRTAGSPMGRGCAVASFLPAFVIALPTFCEAPPCT